MSLHQATATETSAGRSTTRSRVEDPFPDPETVRVVADETRQAILVVLYGASDDPLEFSVLRRRADVEQSARFNYHLQELVGQFVRETPDGYALTPAGEGFIDAMRAAPAID